MTEAHAPLPRFFAEMEAFLLGRTDVAAVSETLGPSPSGGDNFAFYRTLIDRNFHKTLRLLFPSVKVLAGRLRTTLWTELVRDFVAAHPPRGCRDPNRMGAAFSEFLSRRRERDGELPAIVEEMAEYHWIDYLARTATELSDGDGFEKTVFIRQFSYPIPDFMRAITADPAAEEPAAQPTIVVLYRSHRDGAVHILHPRPETMAVFAKRQGLALPPVLAALDETSVRLTEERLVQMGVLRGIDE